MLHIFGRDRNRQILYGILSNLGHRQHSMNIPKKYQENNSLLNEINDANFRSELQIMVRLKVKLIATIFVLKKEYNP